MSAYTNSFTLDCDKSTLNILKTESNLKYIERLSSYRAVSTLLGCNKTDNLRIS